MFAKDQPNGSAGTIKIAIPMAGGHFSGHFGGATEFLVFEAGCPAGPVGAGALHPAPEHKPGSLPDWLASQKMDAVIASAIGERALLMLADAGIETYLSGGGSDPSELAAACLRGQLSRANKENSRCDGAHHDHDGHDCGHH